MIEAFAALETLPRWMAYLMEARGTGKPTKVPYAATRRGGPRQGFGSSTTPDTWGTRREAETRAVDLAHGSSAAMTGVGVALGTLDEDQTLAGIDLDSCIDDNGELAPWAGAILEAVPSYAERSPSGQGIKIFFWVPTSSVRPFLDAIGVERDAWGTKRSIAGLNGANHGPGIEVYAGARFFTVTEQLWDSRRQEIRRLDQEALERLANLIPTRTDAGGGIIGGDKTGASGVSLRSRARSAGQGRDSSRSARAASIAIAMAPDSYEEMTDGLRRHADPDIRAWVQDKGEAYNERELKRVWKRFVADRAKERQDALAELDHRPTAPDREPEIVVSEMEGPRPLRRELPPPPPFPIHALNCAPALKNAALAIEAATQAPLAICGNSVLAAGSMCAQAHGNVEMPYGSLRPLSLFELTVAGSGERKSAADELALKPVHEREAELRLDYEVACREHRADVDAWTAHKAHLQQSLKKDRAALRTALVALGSEPEAPLRPLLLVDNPTVEGLEIYADIGQPSFGLFTAEGGKLIGGHLMNEENRMKAGATLNLLWDGAPVPRLRKDRATKLPGRRLALHIMLQPEIATRMLSDPTLKDLGTLARFLLVAPDSTAGTRLWRQRPAFIDSSLQAYRKALFELLRRKPRKGAEPNELAPLALPLTEQARRLWIDFYNEVERQLGADAPWASIRAFGSKLPEQAARIAGVMALVVNPDTDVIGVEAMEGGIELARYYAAEVFRVSDAGMTDPDLVLAEKLLHWLHANPHREVIHLSEIYQFGPNGIRDKATALRIAAILQDHGWLRKMKAGTEIDGSRRRDAWALIR